MKHNASRRTFFKAGLVLPAVGLLSCKQITDNKYEEENNPMTKEADIQVLLEVLNPRAVLPSIKVSGLIAPRLDSLDGKRILLAGVKPDSVVFFNALEELLKEKYPTLTVKRGSLFGRMIDDTSDFDAWIEGVKTSGDAKADNAAELEKMGIPGVSITVDDLLLQRKRVAECNGLPGMRLVTVPAEKYFVCECKPENLKPIAAAAFNDIIKALTSPLTEEEKNPKPFVYNYGPIQFKGASYDEAYEKFQQYCMDNDMGDGLPLTPPTEEAVKWMLSGTNRSPNEELGSMVPRNGKATIEKVAINAVMAGARPEYLPVIIAAIEGITDIRFNLYHISTGTLNSSAVVWVNGPIAKEIGMNCRETYLGPGNRANSSIGRAISLCMVNIGWGLFKTESGMIGQPTRYTHLIFAENEAESPWESFAVEYGFSPEDSTVTLDECIWYDRLGPSGCMTPMPMEVDMAKLASMVRGFTGGMTPARNAPVNPLFSTMDAESAINGNYCTLALYPALARQLAAAGYTKQSLAQWLCDQHRLLWDDYSDAQQESILKVAKAGSIPGLTVEDCKSGGTIPSFNPRHLAILVAGPMAGQAMAFYGGAATRPNFDNPGSTEIDFMTVKIHGATLTKAGR
jgi:hypothetical protein